MGPTSTRWLNQVTVAETEDLRQLGEIANHARPESLRQPWFVHMPPLSLRKDDIAVCKGNE